LVVNLPHVDLYSSMLDCIGGNTVYYVLGTDCLRVVIKFHLVLTGASKPVDLGYIVYTVI
jgi:hypothetical protein